LKWDPIFRRALDRNPEHRYQSAQEFLDAIAQVSAPPVAEIPLPHLSKVALGGAILVGVVVALAASPAIKSLEPIAPIHIPVQKLHIAPPKFDAVVAPPIAPPARHVAMFAKAPRPKRVAPPATAIVIEPPPALSIASSPLDGQPDAPLPIPAQAIIAPPPAVAAPQPKKTFWGKMNVFKKKKNADSGETSK
jgi:hypothetical protein